MKRELYNYDWYPKVLPAGGEAMVTIRPLGAHAAFPVQDLRAELLGVSDGQRGHWPQTAYTVRFDALSPDADGCLRLRCPCPREEEYYLRLFCGDRQIVQLSIYAVGEDLVGRYPYVGDLHMHTNRSDGKESPAVVAANYRALGYDFLAITDHERYYPSLEAIAAYAGLKTAYCLIAGEEIHLYKNPIHNINFGGRYSINGLLETTKQNTDTGADDARRANGVTPPPIITRDEYCRQVQAIADTLTLPAEVQPYAFCYASNLWIYRRIAEAEGMSIFCHPYWICELISVPEALSTYLLEQHPFDAYELLGGDTPFTANGYQLLQYYDVRSRGIDFPVVGSTDSHDSTEHSRYGNMAKTMVFAPRNEQSALVDAIRAKYSVPIDCRREPGVAGNFRLCKYAWFLLEHHFPIHDQRCAAVGALMKDYACGETELAPQIELLDARIAAMEKRYFAF